MSIDYNLRPYIKKHLSSLEEVPFLKVDVNGFPIPIEMVSQCNKKRSFERGTIRLSTGLKAEKRHCLLHVLEHLILTTEKDQWQHSVFWGILGPRLQLHLLPSSKLIFFLLVEDQITPLSRASG